MELKEARTVAGVIRRTTGGGTYTSEVSKAIVALDDRIIELEAEVKRLEGQLLELNTLISDVY